MSASTPHAQHQISSLHPYQPGMSIDELARTYKLDPTNIIKLASNENPNGPSSAALAAIRKAALEGNRYPDGYDLTAAIAAHHKVTPEHIVLGNGSNDVLDLIARVFLGPGTNAVSSQYAFLVYKLVTQICGAKNIITPAHDYGHDLKAMQAAITKRTRVVWIANPNNPTGTYIDYATLRQFITALPPHVIVVLDEAYCEYLESSEDSTAWLSEHPNLIIVHTFSKIYGLAGLRIGYAVARPETADLLNRVRQPFNVSSPGLAAAVTSLQHPEHITQAKAQNTAELATLKKAFDSLNLSYLPTYGNFITVRFHDALKTHKHLLSQGVIVRPLDNYDMNDFLRITVGTPAENEHLLKALYASST